MLTPTDLQIVDARLHGATTRNIEKITGLDHTTVSRRLHREDIRALIESIQSQVVHAAAQQSADNIIHAISAYQRAESDQQLRDHGYKASLEVLRAIGILPSHTQSIIVNQLNQVNNEIHLDTAARAALQHLGVIDVTPEE